MINMSEIDEKVVKKSTKKQAPEPEKKEHSADQLRIMELEKKVHSMQIDKRITAIKHSWKEFDVQDRSPDFYEGVAYALDNHQPIKHSYAEVTPTTQTRKAKAPGEAFDEDSIKKGDSEL